VGSSEGKTSDEDKTRGKKKSGIGESEVLRFGTELSSMDNEGENTEPGNDNRDTTNFTNMSKLDSNRQRDLYLGPLPKERTIF
jgi:hypothetical protein